MNKKGKTINWESDDTEYLEYLNKELIPNTIKDLLGIDEEE